MRKIYNYNISDYTTENEKSFYLLGLIASDGVLEKFHIKIGLKDKDLLEQIRDDLVPNKPLYYLERDDTWYLKVSCKPIMDWVRSAGITERKSFNLRVEPWVVQSPYFRHFIRGYFDGDGTVGIHAGTNGKSDKIYYRVNVRIGSACPEMLEQIRDFLTFEYGLNRNKLISEKDGTFFRLRYMGDKQAKKLYKIMYDDATIYLKRKFFRYSNILALDNSQRALYYGNPEKMKELNLGLL